MSRGRWAVPRRSAGWRAAGASPRFDGSRRFSELVSEQMEHPSIQHGHLPRPRLEPPPHDASRNLLVPTRLDPRVEPHLRPVADSPSTNACFPTPRGLSAARRFLDVLIGAGGADSFLCVIKDCGAEGQGMLSFPRPGISIALDLAVHSGHAAHRRPIERGGDRRGRPNLSGEGLVHAGRALPRDGAAARELERVRRRWDPGLSHPERPVGAGASEIPREGGASRGHEGHRARPRPSSRREGPRRSACSAANVDDLERSAEDLPNPERDRQGRPRRPLRPPPPGNLRSRARRGGGEARRPRLGRRHRGDVRPSGDARIRPRARPRPPHDELRAYRLVLRRGARATSRAGRRDSLPFCRRSPASGHASP